jgi:hypothetical protein
VTGTTPRYSVGAVRLVHRAAPLDRREIQIVVTNRALQFPRALARQEDDRRMRVDARDRVAAMRDRGL